MVYFTYLITCLINQTILLDDKRLLDPKMTAQQLFPRFDNLDHRAVQLRLLK